MTFPLSLISLYLLSFSKLLRKSSFVDVESEYNFFDENQILFLCNLVQC